MAALLRTGSALATAVLLTACGGKPQFQALPVQEATVKPAEFTDDISTVSTLEAKDLVQLAAQSSGRVQELKVDQGDVVQAGELLVVLDQEQEQAKLRRDEAQARTDAINYERFKYLAEQGAASEMRRDQYQQTALSSHERAVAQKANLGYSNLTSPINGIVADVTVKPGDVLRQGEVFTKLVKNNVLEARVEVPSVFGSRLKLGQPVALLQAGESKPLATSTVASISPTVSAGTQALLVKAVFDNPTGTLRNGQRLLTRLELETKPINAVPFTAVTTSSGQNFVFRVGSLKQLEQQPGNAELEKLKQLPEGTLFALQTPVEVGPVQNNLYPVLKGLKAGERVITSNLMNLKHGLPIQIKPQQSAGADQAAKGKE